jgi:hypothetical protein
MLFLSNFVVIFGILGTILGTIYKHVYILFIIFLILAIYKIIIVCKEKLTSENSE